MSSIKTHMRGFDDVGTSITSIVRGSKWGSFNTSDLEVHRIIKQSEAMGSHEARTHNECSNCGHNNCIDFDE